MKISDSALIIQRELNHLFRLNSIYMQTYVTYHEFCFQAYHSGVEHL